MDMDQLKAENAKLKAEAEASATQAKTLQADLEAAQKSNTETAAQLEQAQTQLKAAQEQVSTLTGEKAQLETDLNAAREQVKTLEANKKTAEQEAANIAVTAGVEPEPVNLQASSQGGSLRAQYNAIKDPKAKADFFAKHREAMRKEILGK